MREVEMKKAFTVKGIEGIKEITCDDIRDTAMEGYGADIYDSITNEVDVESELIDDVLENGGEKEVDIYNEWFDNGILDNAAFLVIWDHIHEGYEDYAAPIEVYRNGTLALIIDQEEIEDMLD